ncbi:MAG TPA: hypothetical protein VLW54_10705 [Candidatus Acidoferrales bacterium]|nr:hypothetical protein [Candidatus Acidoferrales bacterium]
MRRTYLLIPLMLLAAMPVLSEELVLKDGTKIVGKMTAITDDTIQVETSYGTMSVKRSDIVSITFPENGAPPATTAPPAEAKPEAPGVDESLEGTQYVNRTGNFSLTLPPDWRLNPEIRTVASALAGLSSKDDLRYLVVDREEYNGTMESYEGLVELQAKRNLQDYVKVSETPVTIDGKAGMMLSYRGLSPSAKNLPIQFLSVVFRSGGSYFHMTAWCVEPLYKENEASFEKTLRSFHETAAQPKS